ncbi:MAG TPA: hypothetical protein VNU92_05075 [Edaphobacter sp.]|jgi:hypothetical protein|nr:hypothetical protein [Edaphobacter sp.]
MTNLQKLCFATIFASGTLTFAASVPKDPQKTIQPENVILCESSCETKTLYGRKYKVIDTPRYTVMVSLSKEGIYTRADVSITNHTDMPLPMSPDDFRVEVVTPKPKVLLYVPPPSFVLPQPAVAPSNAVPQPVPPVSTFAANDPAAPSSSEEEKQKVDDTDHNLAATSIAPNEVISGRVYFERDKRAHLVNVVLPIAGLVFEFPYALKK